MGDYFCLYISPVSAYAEQFVFHSPTYRSSFLWPGECQYRGNYACTLEWCQFWNMFSSIPSHLPVRCCEKASSVILEDTRRGCFISSNARLSVSNALSCL